MSAQDEVGSLGSFREPKQGRTRDTWERVISIATEMFERGGIDALSMTEVCRLAGIAPPSLYARVDGRDGLFAAVYERGMVKVREAQLRGLGGLPDLTEPPEQRSRTVIATTWGVFRDHAPFLRSVIGYSVHCPPLLARGAEESRMLISLVAGALGTDARVGQETARMIYAECVLRTMYGADFLTRDAESDEEFISRLSRLAASQLRFS